MKKKLLALVLVIVLGVTSVVGGTLAYLQDDDSAVNVMTLGNVYIEQLEYERADGVAYNAIASKAENTLVPYTQGQSLYPAVPNPDAAAPYQAAGTDDMFYWGDYVFTGTSASGLWNDANLANVMDKMVFVKNTGTSDLYFRTIIAFEHPEGTTFGDAQQGHDIGFNGNGYGQTGAAYKWTGTGTITVDGVRYAVYEALYDAMANGNGILKPGQTSHPSLLQVVMHHSLDNEDVAKYGETYDILVLSQAIQTEGFSDAQTALDTGFGKTSEKAAEWFGGEEFKAPSYVSDAKELAAALAEGGEFTLAKDISLTEVINIPEGTTTVLDLNGKTISAASGNAIKNEGTLTITGGTVSSASTYAVNNSGTLAVDGATLSGVFNAGSATLTNTTVNNVISGRHAVYHSGSALTINGGSFSSTSGNELINAASSNVTINGGTFTMSGKSYLFGPMNAGIAINGGTFNGYVNADGSNDKMRFGAAVVKGGTFNFDPTAWVATGYTVTESNGTWTVAEN